MRVFEFMKTSSPERLEVARRNLKNILQAASSCTEEDLAKAMQVSDSVVQRLKSVHGENFAALLAELNLKIVPAHVKCYEPGYVDALKTLARAQVNDNAVPCQLEWD